MGQGLGEILTEAIAVAISPIGIIVVILLLFSKRANANGPLFLTGWVLGLAVLTTVVYVISDEVDASSSSGTSDTISWGKIAIGLIFLLLAARQWRGRPAPGVEPEAPKWVAGLDRVTPGKALGLGGFVACASPKNLLLCIAAGAGLAQLGLSTGDAIGSIVVFVVIGSLTIAGPVLYHLVGGEKAKAALEELKGWLGLHNAAVMTVLFLVVGVNLIAKGIPPLTS